MSSDLSFRVFYFDMLSGGKKTKPKDTLLNCAFTVSSQDKC